MLFSSFVLASLFTFILSVSAVPRPRTDAGISSPASGAIIAPEQEFDFSYNSMADYGVSSYNFTVWLVTSPPTSLAASTNFMDGWFFGRFSEANYPANPYPVNPAPSTLVMPDFSKSAGGWGVGATGSNVPVYFVVLEEYAMDEGVVGNRMCLSVQQITYNGTTSN